MEDGKAIPLHAKRVVSLPRNNEKLTFSKRTEPNQNNLLESTFTKGVYEQSGLRKLEKLGQAGGAGYLVYFSYQAKNFRANLLKKNVALNPLPQGYNTLAK